MKLVFFLFVAILVVASAFEADWQNIKSINLFKEPKNLTELENDSSGSESSENDQSQEISVRIIGGSEVKDHGKPFQVGLILDGKGFCGGSLISKNYVLTAAHCLKGMSTVQVIFGAHNIQKNESSQVVLTSKDLRIHPKYNQFAIINDIGLVKLPKSIELNENIQIIKLATEGNFVGKTVSLSGWGKTNIIGSLSPVLKEVDLRAISNLRCGLSGFGFSIRSSMICTSGGIGVVAPRGACNGDSGGPLVYGDKQIGIVSFGSRYCVNGVPSVYTRITSFTKWISDNSDVQL